MAFIIIGGSNNLVKNLTMFKIQLENKEFYKSKSGRIQHYRSTEKAEAKIKKLGEIAVGAIAVESKARTAVVKTINPEEIVPETKVVKVSKVKKALAKAKKTEDGATDASGKTKKPKKSPSND
jgi:hypothetical protein